MATLQPTQNEEPPEVGAQAQAPAPSQQPAQEPTEISEDHIYVALTHDHLNYQSVIDRVRSPEAGAIVVFAGTTRNNFNSLPVQHLSYTSYAPLALRTMLTICRSILTKHGLKGIAMVHRLGVVPIGEESILSAVSSPHRQAAWRAGEEALEECKAKVE
ncbi:Molybdopterin synthase catalytic subunit, partial [Neurospora sp. IMI 360204]